MDEETALKRDLSLERGQFSNKKEKQGGRGTYKEEHD
jgi:hypothetical protein